MGTLVTTVILIPASSIPNDEFPFAATLEMPHFRFRITHRLFSPKDIVKHLLLAENLIVVIELRKPDLFEKNFQAFVMRNVDWTR